MKLKTIQIKNYRSISNIDLDFQSNNDTTSTYSFIGVNEAGKSSLLKAIALKDMLFTVSQKDFKDRTEDIEIVFSYLLSDKESEWYQQHFSGKLEEGKVKAWKEIRHSIFYSYEDPTAQLYNLDIISNDEAVTVELDIDEDLKGRNEIPNCVFWTADDKYLISKPINLATFAANPEVTSIPLRNCFLLSGITDIKSSIEALGSDSTEIEHLQNTLGEKVTEHIKAIWPNHPITITFLITNGLIHFHVKDGGNGRAKTAEQRSDGFKQFVSFLLTISAENKNSELENTILLLDEPETHLHPQAQEYLLNELKRVTQNERGNIALYATHSIFMIDKIDLSKNYIVAKKHETTEVLKFNKPISTYASVIYEVFDIPSSDYHNQLYGKLHELFQDEDQIDESRELIKTFDTKFLHDEKNLKKDHPFKKVVNGCTLPTYIRNCIHHPDNGNSYTEPQLKKSIGLLREYLQFV
jgi:predicted ATP-dependent endonuclease of OLD family